MRILKLTLFLFVYFLVVSNNLNAQSNSFNAGKDYFDKGQFIQAIPFFTVSIKTNDDKRYQSLLYRGESYLFLNQLNEAKKDLTSSKVGLTDSFMPDLNAAFGMLYNRKGENKKALEYFTMAINARPGFALAYNNRGITWQDMGNFRNALADYSAAIRIDSTFALAYSNRGSATYYDQNIAEAHTLDIESAIRDFTKAYTLNSNLRMAIRNRALCYQFLKKNSLALEDINSALQCESDNPINYIVRGAIHYDMQNYPEAESDFRKSLKINPLLPEAYLQLGITIARMGNIIEGLSMEDSAIKIDKRYSAMASYTKAQIYAISGEKESMLKQLEMARKQDYFRNRKNYELFFKSTDFTPFHKDKEFKSFVNNLRSNGAAYFK